jgi:hypothetical protein
MPSKSGGAATQCRRFLKISFRRSSTRPVYGWQSSNGYRRPLAVSRLFIRSNSRLGDNPEDSQRRPLLQSDMNDAPVRSLFGRNLQIAHALPNPAASNSSIRLVRSRMATRSAVLAKWSCVSLWSDTQNFIPLGLFRSNGWVHMLLR